MMTFEVSRSQKALRAVDEERVGEGDTAEAEDNIRLSISVDEKPLQSRLFPGNGNDFSLAELRRAVEHLMR